MDFYSTVFELIDLRSFSNLWFWIALAVVWSSASHWIIGVPFDMIQRARRGNETDQEDLEDMVRVHMRRLLHIGRVSGLWLLGLTSFFLTALTVLAFVYWVEFAQAVFLLGFPMTLVGAMALSTAKKIEAQELIGDDLIRCLLRHRFWIQVIGIFSIFVTAMFGMYQNLNLGALGF